MGPDRKFDVVGLGVSTLDLLLVVDELPGRECVQQASDYALQGGGPVATALVALARLGSRTAMLDKVGDDWRGKLILDEFRKEDVATEWMRVAFGRTSSIASILVRKGDGARSIVFSPGDAGELHPDELPESVIAAAKVLHLNGRHWDASRKAAQLARAHGVKVSFDGGANRYRDDIHELIALTDICIVARQFARAFSGTDVQEVSARRLLDAGPECVVITAGVEGSMLFAKGMEGFHQPAFSVDSPIDTTGAGDAYHGAFLHGIVTGLDLKGCAVLAAAVAALNTRKLGGRSALPTLVQAEQFLARHTVQGV
ncbi:MAG TPA: PfkB family carbohydrate kinase [Geobacteraceae bacterium]|nr:PfkB family carbohydrate kinase [Geobacteraceae bacterium]